MSTLKHKVRTLEDERQEDAETITEQAEMMQTLLQRQSGEESASKNEHLEKNLRESNARETKLGIELSEAQSECEKLTRQLSECKTMHTAELADWSSQVRLADPNRGWL